KPLTILDHLGGSPFLCVASHSAGTRSDYDSFVTWIKRTATDAEKIVERKAPADGWAKYQALRPKIVDLLSRADQANRDNLFPALAGGQTAIVFDTGAESQRWVAPMPESPNPLPMLEIGLSGSVTDAAKLRAAVQQYFYIVQDAISLLHDVNPEEV